MNKDKDIRKTKHNANYYNQILRNSEKKKDQSIKQLEEGFASREIDLSKYIIVPSGYEGLGYTLYTILIPYIVGITFLFFYVANGVYTNFSFLDLSSFLLIWAIGYEITAAFILFIIFISFLRYLKSGN